MAWNCLLFLMNRLVRSIYFTAILFKKHPLFSWRNYVSWKFTIVIFLLILFSNTQIQFIVILTFKIYFKEREIREKERERNINVFIGWFLHVPWSGTQYSADWDEILNNWTTWPGNNLLSFYFFHREFSSAAASILRME